LTRSLEPSRIFIPASTVRAVDWRFGGSGEGNQIEKPIPVDGERHSHRRRRALFTDPVGLLETRYGWGTANFDARSFLANLCALVEAVGEPARLRQLPRRVEEQLAGRSVPEADTNPATQLIASFVRGDEWSELDIGISLFPLRPTATGASDAGLAVTPFAFGSADVSFPLSPQLTLDFDATVALDSGIALQFRPGQPMKLNAGLLGSGGVIDSATGKVIVRLTYAAPTGGSLTLMGLPGGGMIEVASIAFGAGADASKGALAPSFLAQLAGGHAKLNWDGSDSFLGSLMPSGGVDANFDLGIRWSGAQGFTFEGSASADIDIPLGASIGGLRINALHIGLRPSGSNLAIEASLTSGATIGPVAISLDRVGTLATLAFHDGNLGPVDLQLAFQPPDGAGLSIDAHGVLTGGGFLFHDPAQELYAGVLQLSLHDEVTLTAYGLIATKMPDGSRGYSLLIFITADGFEPVQLGFGFMLTAIGGMIGINRTFDQDVIRAGLKNDTLKSLLFPRDPINNAPAVIQALSSSFPAKQGSYLLGLLARLTWFTPTLATFDLALILEFGARKRLLALGRVSILLPTSDNDLIRINLDSMGVLDFDAGTVALDATLVDSRLLQRFTITGSAALRAGWGSAPGSSFLLSVGGFNPHFTPPAGIPAVDRVSISLSSGNNPKLHLDAYFAVTSNSVEFGAHASLYAEAGGFSISGDLGFDVLITHPPLKYIADFQATVQLKYESHNLFKLDVKGSLAGSKPTRLSGKASFSILWCDFSVPFDHTFDSGSGADQLPSVSGSSLLVAAFSDSTNWTVQRVPGVAHGVALRTTPAGAAVLLDPLGQLKATQLVVPLNTARAIDTINGTGSKTGARGATRPRAPTPGACSPIASALHARRGLQERSLLPTSRNVR
jgi:hypothetical protein